MEWQTVLNEVRGMTSVRRPDGEWNPDDTWTRVVREMGEEIDRLRTELAKANDKANAAMFHVDGLLDRLIDIQTAITHAAQAVGIDPDGLDDVETLTAIAALGGLAAAQAEKGGE